MQVQPFLPEYLPQAAALFAAHFQRLRQAVPILPDTLAAPGMVQGFIKSLMSQCPGLAVVESGTLLGYMGWYVLDDFRNTGRKAAYCPVWGHSATSEELRIYRMLYNAAAEHWTAEGCALHAITILADDNGRESSELEKFWFWNGFGLLVVDAIRPAAPFSRREALPGFELRKATLEDMDCLVRIEAEHWAHYSRPPTLMAPQTPAGIEEFRELLADPGNSVWLAWDEAYASQDPVGFIRFERGSFGAAEVVKSEDGIAITGAYVNPEYRGRKIAPALLNAALQDYAGQGFNRCSVDFESFNPEAANFWLRYFYPVCLSVIRAPERMLAKV